MGVQGLVAGRAGQPQPADPFAQLHGVHLAVRPGLAQMPVPEPVAFALGDRSASEVGSRRRSIADTAPSLAGFAGTPHRGIRHTGTPFWSYLRRTT